MCAQAAAELRQHVIPDPNSADATIRTLLRLAHKVFREYQRQLYDPAFADIGSMDEAELQRQREALQVEWRRVLDAGKKAEVTAREKRELAFQADDTIDRLKATHAALDAQHGKPSAKTVQRRETNLARLRRKVCACARDYVLDSGECSSCATSDISGQGLASGVGSEVDRGHASQ